jgi:hypothetical protein
MLINTIYWILQSRCFKLISTLDNGLQCMNGASGSIVARPTESDPDPDSFL